jgi:hypothetical protein
MKRFKNKQHAIEFASENGLNYSWSVFCLDWWYVGTPEELENIGCFELGGTNAKTNNSAEAC